jgi:hypothetical protein
VDAIIQDFRFRRLLLVDGFPVVTGVAVLALVAALHPPVSRVLLAQTAWGGLVDSRGGRVVVVAVLLVVAAFLLIVLRFAVERWLWGRLPDGVSRFANKQQRRRRVALERSRSRATEVAPRLRAYPSDPGRVRPTRLANVLAAVEEDLAREYGLDAVVAWPRLNDVLASRTRGMVEQRRDRMDGAARAAASALVVGFLVCVVALSARSPVLLVVAVTAGLTAQIGYRGAVRAAHAYGEALRVAFDLHRFDMLAALRIPLPQSADQERALGNELSRMWTRGTPVDTVYRHAPLDEDVLERVENAVTMALTPPPPVSFRGTVQVVLAAATPMPDNGRCWRVPVGRRVRLEVTLFVGSLPSHDRDEARPGDAIATEHVDVRGRAAPRVQVEVEIDAPFVDVTVPHHDFDVATDEDLKEGGTYLLVGRPGRYDLQVTLFSGGRLIQAVPIELLAVE